MGQRVYRDDLVKVDGVRKIRRREVKNHYPIDDPSRAVNLADPDVAPLARGLIDAADALSGRAKGY
jgi:hypothetical protein